MYKLVLLRHGESTWNKENRFTGWTDVDLSDTGREEAKKAGELLKDGGYVFDVAFTSVLTRAIRTLFIALDGLDLLWIPVLKRWQLNERHYGALQGLNKAETAAKHGDEQTKIWRRSYDIPPPPLTPDDQRHPSHDPRYAGLDPKDLPATECLKDTVARFLPLWHERDRAGHQQRQASPHRRARQQPSRAGEVSRRHLGRRHRRAQHPDGHPAGLRARRAAEADQELLPRRSRGGQARRGEGGGADKGRLSRARLVGFGLAGPGWSRVDAGWSGSDDVVERWLAGRPSNGTSPT